jgi:ubiquinone/menaquinone biosynthesis C-methylase UbiE
MGTSVQELYGDLWHVPRPGFDERIGRSLNPRGSALLKQLFLETGIHAQHAILDAGCRDASFAIELAQTYGCQAIALDPCEAHIQLAAQQVADAGLQGQVTPTLGRLEALPLPNASIDRIWCRDVMNHVDLPAAVNECARALRHDGAMVAFQTLGTPLLEPQEEARLCQALAIVPENMSLEHFEECARAAGFRIVQREAQGSESREYALEAGTLSFDATLLRLARMRRMEAELVDEYGRAFYEAAYALELWGIYQMLGKLFNHIHVLRKR